MHTLLRRLAGRSSNMSTTTKIVTFVFFVIEIFHSSRNGPKHIWKYLQFSIKNCNRIWHETHTPKCVLKCMIGHRKLPNFHVPLFSKKKNQIRFLMISRFRKWGTSCGVLRREQKIIYNVFQVGISCSNQKLFKVMQL